MKSLSTVEVTLSSADPIFEDLKLYVQGREVFLFRDIIILHLIGNVMEKTK